MALPPGPRSPALFQMLSFVLHPDRTILSNMRRYGHVHTIKNPILGPQVIVSEPDLVKQVFTGDPEVFHAGEVNRMATFIVGPASVMVLDDAPHRRERKRMMPAFVGERMLAYTGLMRDAAIAMVSGWRAGEELSLMTAMQRLTVDVIFGAVFGVGAGPNATLLKEAILGNLTQVQTATGMLLTVPAFQRNLGPLTPWAAFVRARARADELLKAEITARREALNAGTEPPGSDVLTTLLQVRDEDGQAMTDSELRDELITLLLAGFETTATMLCWTFELLLRDDEAFARLLTEILRAGDDATQKVGELPFLDAVLKEALRMYPVLPTLGRKTTAPVKLGGFDLPAGTMVMPAAYATHHREDLYPDPEVFKPERFLGKKVDPYAWFPFGGGARRCLGMAFALHEMKVVLATVLPRVRLRLSRPGPLKIQLRSFFFGPKGGTRVVVDTPQLN